VIATRNRSEPNSEERPSEDELARAALGGVKGSRKLPPAPMTEQEAEQISPNEEPGHVA
jgi:hypothetical protein